jgi:hypothetical protein
VLQRPEPLARLAVGKQVSRRVRNGDDGVGQVDRERLAAEGEASDLSGIKGGRGGRSR